MSPRCADRQSFVLCPGGHTTDRPCGTGTSAKVACLAADGKYIPAKRDRRNLVFRPIGSRFSASLNVWRKTMVRPEPRCDRLGPRRAFVNPRKSPFVFDRTIRPGLNHAPPRSAADSAAFGRHPPRSSFSFLSFFFPFPFFFFFSQPARGETSARHCETASNSQWKFECRRFVPCHEIIAACESVGWSAY